VHTHTGTHSHAHTHAHTRTSYSSPAFIHPLFLFLSCVYSSPLPHLSLSDLMLSPLIIHCYHNTHTHTATTQHTHTHTHTPTPNPPHPPTPHTPTPTPPLHHLRTSHFLSPGLSFSF